MVEATLRQWSEPVFPERPYPVLLPYTHPDLLAGRDRELANLRRLLLRDVPITGFYAPSGTGKSSFLLAGLVHGLRREGHPIALDRHPSEPGIASRLLADLLLGDVAVKDEDPQAFVDRLNAVRELAEMPPILVVDQFEDLLHRRGAGHARAKIGLLLATSAGREDPPCRWVLAYRRESHGEVMLWLQDVLELADEFMGEMQSVPLQSGILPRDFSGPERFQSLPLESLGKPAPGKALTACSASEVFRDVIVKPLEAGHYPWRIPTDGLDRLARAFGEARLENPEAPLVPELQVVLAHLLEAGGEPLPGETLKVEVPKNVGELIEQALEDHLRRALDAAFPLGGRGSRALRTRALLALRELADAEGRRGDALSSGVLARAIGEEGGEVLKKLATASTRLVVPVRREGELAYTLSHDRLAEVLVRLVDEGRFEGLGVDRELLELRRFVALQCGLFLVGEVGSGTEIPAKEFVGIDAHREALLWGEERERWWEACRKRHRRKKRRTRRRTMVAGFLLLLISLGTWHVVDRQEKLDALLDEVAQGDPEPAFVAAHTLLVEWKRDPEEIRERLRLREEPMILLDRGISEVEGESREAAVSRIAEMALPLITEDAPEDPTRIGSFVWALDFFALKEERTREMRNVALAALREKYPPPPLPETTDPLWAEIPAGTFGMGAGPDEGRDDPNMKDEYPRHQVTISAFRMGIYEVTNAEFRRLVVSHAEGQDDRLPAAHMTWNEAYTYAAWLGGRLPTEAEAEYVRRGGCKFPYCDRNGEQATLDEIAWLVRNAAKPGSKESTTRPVGLLEPNPWGLYDLYGNVSELCADWHGGSYTTEPRKDPPGAAVPAYEYRMVRGGSVEDSTKWAVSSGREVLPVGARSRTEGLRVVFPSPE